MLYTEPNRPVPQPQSYRRQRPLFLKASKFLPWNVLAITDLAMTSAMPTGCVRPFPGPSALPVSATIAAPLPMIVVDSAMLAAPLGFLPGFERT